MGTMKDESFLGRPHSLAAGLLLGIAALGVCAPTKPVATLVAVLGILISLAAIPYVGRATDKATTRIERTNMAAFVLVFTLMIFN